MLRVVLGVASLLVLGGLVMRHAVTLPRATALPLPAHVDQGIPLATIDLRATDQPLTPDEVAGGTTWWQHQRQPLLDRLTDLLRNESRADGWTGLYLSELADGRQVLVVVGNQGRRGTVHFAGDGTLLACDDTPDEVLPIVLPSADAGFRRPGAAAVRGIVLRLRYLREHSPVAWDPAAVPTILGIAHELPPEDDELAKRPARVTGPCFVRGGPHETPAAPAPEPAPPVANN